MSLARLGQSLARRLHRPLHLPPPPPPDHHATVSRPFAPIHANTCVRRLCKLNIQWRRRDFWQVWRAVACPRRAGSRACSPPKSCKTNVVRSRSRSSPKTTIPVRRRFFWWLQGCFES
ncbi:hypothetical protein VPH35_019575 [Triticum aestivum]